MIRILASFALISMLAWAGDGRPPRASSADYPVRQDIKTATIAAVRVAPDQLNKTFPSDLAKKYIVIEVAIYPKDGATAEVAARNFSLRLGESEAHPDTAEDVAWMWRPHNTPHPDTIGNTHVTTETGVMVASGRDPVTGRRVNEVGTYEGVGVSNYPTQPAPPSSSRSGVDADRMQAKLDNWALPEGRTTSPIAGYLYFPMPSKKVKGALRLEYERGDSTATLILPSK